MIRSQPACRLWGRLQSFPVRLIWRTAGARVLWLSRWKLHGAELSRASHAHGCVVSCDYWVLTCDLWFELWLSKHGRVVWLAFFLPEKGWEVRCQFGLETKLRSSMDYAEISSTGSGNWTAGGGSSHRNYFWLYYMHKEIVHLGTFDGDKCGASGYSPFLFWHLYV